MLKVKCLTVKRGGKTILNDIHTELSPHELVALVGTNGQGKSTFIEAISGIIKAEYGELSYNGKDIKAFSLKELSRIRTVLSQKIHLPFDINVYDFLMLGLSQRKKLNEADFASMDEMIVKFELEDYLERSIQKLSGGEQQRVVLAKTILQLYPFKTNENAYLFLDEPLSALDLKVQKQVILILKELVRDFPLSIVIVMHDLNFAARYCDKIWVLADGKIQVNASPKESLTCENIKNYFNIDVDISLKDDRPVIIY